MTCRFAVAAQADVIAILKETSQRFEPRQRQRYSDLIDCAAMMLGSNPDRLGGLVWLDVIPGLRGFHLDLAATRRGAASHILYYVTDPVTRDAAVIRVLHERMEPARHMTRGLQ